MSAPAGRQTVVRTVTAAREVARTAPARCRCYGTFSELLASPLDVDVRAALQARHGAATGLPFSFDLDDLLQDRARQDQGQLGAQYSGLFEVGSAGPPAPIREDLHTGQKAGTREDIVRYYDYFGYRLDERFAWAPDHLSVELEFMHYLVYHEAGVTGDALSWQLAQADFATRHLQNWLPQLAQAVGQLAPDTFYCRVLHALGEFVERDLAWQNSTIVSGPASAS